VSLVVVTSGDFALAGGAEDPPLPRPTPLPPRDPPLPRPPLLTPLPFPPIIEPWKPLFIPAPCIIPISPGITPGNPNCAGAPFIIPIEEAICAIIAIWFIIISCNTIGFAIPAIAFISMAGNPPGIIMFGSGELFTMLSIRDWMSSWTKPLGALPFLDGPAGPPTRSNRLLVFG
jgi:hypothetical protein